MKNTTCKSATKSNSKNELTSKKNCSNINSSTQTKLTEKVAVQNNDNQATENGTSNSGKLQHHGFKPYYFENLSDLKLEYHKSTEMIPIISGDEMDSLRKDIAENGFIDPIVLTRDIKIIDGRARYEIFKTGLMTHQPNFVMIDDEEKQLIPFILSKNYFRRHLTQGQKTLLAIKLSNLLNPKDNKNENKAKGTETPLNVSSSTAIKTPNRRDSEAAQYGVSPSFWGKGEVVIKNKPELADKVLNNEISLEQAYNQSKPEPVKPKVDIVEEPETVKLLIGFLQETGLTSNGLNDKIQSRLRTEASTQTTWLKTPDSLKFVKVYDKFIELIREKIDSKNYKNISDKLTKAELKSPQNNDRPFDSMVQKLETMLDNNLKVHLANAIEFLKNETKALANIVTLEQMIKQFNQKLNEVYNVC